MSISMKQMVCIAEIYSKLIVLESLNEVITSSNPAITQKLSVHCGQLWQFVGRSAFRYFR